MSEELEKIIAANNAKIDQVSGSLRELLTSFYCAGLGDVVLNQCTEHIRQLMQSENTMTQLVGSFAMLGMTRTMASVGETIIADQEGDAS